MSDDLAGLPEVNLKVESEHAAPPRHRKPAPARGRRSLTASRRVSDRSRLRRTLPRHGPGIPRSGKCSGSRWRCAGEALRATNRAYPHRHRASAAPERTVCPARRRPPRQAPDTRERGGVSGRWRRQREVICNRSLTAATIADSRRLMFGVTNQPSRRIRSRHRDSRHRS